MAKTKDMDCKALDIEDDELYESTKSSLQVKEFYPGFFDIPNQCVPFNLTTEDLSDHMRVGSQGFPAVLDLSSHFEDEASTSEEPNNNKKKSIFTLALEKRNKCAVSKEIEKTSSHTKLKEVNQQKNGTNMLAEVKNAVIEEAIKKIELMDDPNKMVKIGGFDAGTENRINESSRLAVDHMHFDFAKKCLENIIPRQEQQVIRIFDTLAKTSCSDENIECKNRGKLHQLARSQIEAVKALYLEQIKSEENDRLIWQFYRGIVNHSSYGAWTLSPIRRVLDAIQKRRIQTATSDDNEIVQLSLLWTILLMDERPTIFHAFANPNEIYCRMAEVFLIGPEMFKNEIVEEYISVMINSFLIEIGEKRLINLQLQVQIASLDAFMPFYEDMLVRFEEFSEGDTNFSLTLLIGAYMNSSIGDGLLMAQQLWSPGRNIVRQMTLPKMKAKKILDHFMESRQQEISIFEDEYYNEYGKLLAMYTAAIRDGVVLPERNPVTYTIACRELGFFIRMHTKTLKDGSRSEERIKEMDLLVDIIRGSLTGKLQL